MAQRIAGEVFGQHLGPPTLLATPLSRSPRRIGDRCDEGYAFLRKPLADTLADRIETVFGHPGGVAGCAQRQRAQRCRRNLHGVTARSVRPWRNTRPGKAPVMAPLSITGTPLINR